MTTNEYKVKKIELNNEEKELYDYLIKEKNEHPLLAKYIAKKEHINKSNLEIYLNPVLRNLDDSNKIKDLNKAIKLIQEKIAKGESDEIMIVGDYDTDGITASSVMYWFFKEKYNVKLKCYIPERVEGYGLRNHIIDYAVENGYNFIITVDNGIAAIEPVKYAKEKGLTIIVTDHHQIQDDTIPIADAVCNTVQKDCEYRDKYISGVGMAWNICRNIDYDLALDLLPIVAVGTIADVVPLINENRIYVNEGLKNKPKDKYLGLLKLMNHSGLTHMTSLDVGFKIAPIINSAGREGFAQKAFQLLTETDENKVNEIFQEMLDFNTNRKETQREIENDISPNIEADGKHSLTIYPKNDVYYNASVVGIVASKVVEKYKLPTIIFAEKEILVNNVKTKVYSGSARGVSWFNFMDLIVEMKKENLLVGGGGHKLAAGLTIMKEDILKVEALFEELAKKTYEPVDTIDVYEIIEFPLDKQSSKNIIKDLFKLFKKLEPIGASNELPKIRYDFGNINDIKTMGKDEIKKHFSFRTESGIRVIAWNKCNKNGDLPNLKNKLFLSEIVESSFVNENEETIKFFEFQLKDVCLN